MAPKAAPKGGKAKGAPASPVVTGARPGGPGSPPQPYVPRLVVRASASRADTAQEVVGIPFPPLAPERDVRCPSPPASGPTRRPADAPAPAPGRLLPPPPRQQQRRQVEDEEPPPPPPPTEGKFFYPDGGATYEGQFRYEPAHEGEDLAELARSDPDALASRPRLRHGRGRLVEDGCVYDGDWVDDKATGRGTFAFASGATYTGDVVDGRYQGEGTYTWGDGAGGATCRKYVGRWEDSLMHGPGEYTDAGGRRWTGSFYRGSGPGLTALVD